MRLIPLILILALGAAACPGANPGLHDFLEQLGIHENPESLQPAPIPGFLEVTQGMQVLYVSVDGRLVIRGDILSVPTETNLTEMRRAAMRRDLLKAVPDDQTLIVPASGPTVGRVVVFTDTNCRYCALLHSRRDELLQQGIEIQYLFYPRSGPTSDSFDQAVTVWCSDDRVAALDRALRGAVLSDAECANPVLQHYELARELDLKGTPAVITANGTLRYGMHSPDEILAIARGR